MNFANFLRTPYLQKTSGQLLLNFELPYNLAFPVLFVYRKKVSMPKRQYLKTKKKSFRKIKSYRKICELPVEYRKKVITCFFYKQRFFQSQRLLNFLTNEFQKLLKCCLFHGGFVLPRHGIFCIFVSMPTSRSVYVLFM